MKITPENVFDFPKGTKVEFYFGAYYPTVEGVVTGFEILPATKHFPCQAHLVAEYIDIEDDKIVKITIGEFSDTGIGTRLIEMADKQNIQSKWSKSA
jgi:hypothetical protein